MEYAETVSMLVIHLKVYQNHKIICYENETTRKVPLDEKKKLHQVKSTKLTWLVPLVIYFDTEALIVPIHTSASAPNTSGQMKME